MREFDFGSYCTEYSCSGTYQLKMRQRACFRNAFNAARQNSKIKYKVIVYKGVKYCRDSNYANACLLSKQELRNHLRQLKSLYPFKYMVRDDTKGDYPRFKVTLWLENVPATFHKYVLTWLRYSYEYPYNVILKDTYRLKKEFLFVSVANLFNVVSNCYATLQWVGEGHSILESHVRIPLKKKDLKENIKNNNRLEDLYEVYHNINPVMLPEKIDNFGICDLEYWSEENFEKYRKECYIKMYNKIKER